MSFHFQKEFRQTGVIISYWELYSIEVNRINKITSWKIAGWINQDFRAQGKDPVAFEEFNAAGNDYPLNPDGPAEQALIAVFEGISQQDSRFQV